MLTLLGPAGVGKTLLARHAAHAVSAAFPDGVSVVELATIVEPNGFVPAIAAALAVREARDEALPTTLARAIGMGRMLLVLDNCEQLIAAAGEMAALLAAYPGLRLLAASQTAFGLRGELTLTLAPLALPEHAPGAGVEAIWRAPAVALFVARAQSAQPAWTPTAQSAPAVAAICRLLDGLRSRSSWSRHAAGYLVLLRCLSGSRGRTDTVVGSRQRAGPRAAGATPGTAGRVGLELLAADAGRANAVRAPGRVCRGLRGGRGRSRVPRGARSERAGSPARRRGRAGRAQLARRSIRRATATTARG